MGKKNKPKTSKKSRTNHRSAEAQFRLREAKRATQARKRHQEGTQARELTQGETGGNEAELNRHRRRLSPHGEPGHQADLVTQTTGRLVVHTGGAESSRANDGPDDDWEARRARWTGEPMEPRPEHRRGGNPQPRRTSTGVREGVPAHYRGQPVPRWSRFGVAWGRPRTLGEDLNGDHSNQHNSTLSVPEDRIANLSSGDDDEESPVDSGEEEEEETMGDEESSDEESPSESEGDHQETDGESDQGQHQEAEEQAAEERQ